MTRPAFLVVQQLWIGFNCLILPYHCIEIVKTICNLIFISLCFYKIIQNNSLRYWWMYNVSCLLKCSLKTTTVTIIPLFYTLYICSKIANIYNRYSFESIKKKFNVPMYQCHINFQFLTTCMYWGSSDSRIKIKHSFYNKLFWLKQNLLYK